MWAAQIALLSVVLKRGWYTVLIQWWTPEFLYSVGPWAENWSQLCEQLPILLLDSCISILQTLPHVTHSFTHSLFCPCITVAAQLKVHIKLIRNDIDSCMTVSMINKKKMIHTWFSASMIIFSEFENLCRCWVSP